MRKVKEPRYDEYQGDEELENGDYTAAEADYDDSDDDVSFLNDHTPEGVRRTWRDTEKYMEIRELYKIINDELYTGIYTEDIFNNQDYDY